MAIQSMFCQTLQFLNYLETTGYRPVLVGKLVAGRTLLRANNGAWKEELKSSHLKSRDSTCKVPDVWKVVAKLLRGLGIQVKAA